MTFLDSSAIIEYLRGNRTLTEYLDEQRPWWTSTICVFEVLNGPAGSEGFDPIEERQRFGGVRALEFNRVTVYRDSLTFEGMERYIEVR